MADNVISYGFTSLADLMGQRVSQLGVGVLDRAINESAVEWNRIANTLTSTMVQRTTLAKQRYNLPGAGTLQPLDQWGNPLPVREGGYFDVAFPIFGGGTAWGDNRVSRALMTVADANRFTVEALRRDADWLRRHMLAALLDSVGWTFSDALLGNLSVVPLANADAATYVLTGGTVATDTHYLFQNAVIADANNPFPTLYTELHEHPSNLGRDIIVYIPTANIAAVEGLTAFVGVSDPRITPAPAAASLNGLIDVGLGDRVLGRVDNCWAVEWAALPTDYLLATVEGLPPLMMREYDAPQLQGFFPELHSPDGNTAEHRWLRYAGFGVANRVSAAVMMVDNAQYDVHTSYDAPLSV